MNPKDEPKVIIDCKDEGWDNVLYESLGSKKPVELRNLHSSYEPYMHQLADHYLMNFIGRLEENKGEFKRRD